MSGHSATAWLDTVLSSRDNHPDSVTADSSPHSKRRRLQSPTPTVGTDDGAPVASGLEAPTQHLPDTNEEPQTSHSSDRQQTAPTVSSPSPALPRQGDESDTSDDSWIGSADDRRFRVKKREFDELDPFSSPSSLEALLKQIRPFSNGVGILPSSARRRFNKLKREEMAWARQGSKSNKHYSQERESLGEIPSPEEVLSIVFKNSQYSFIEDDRGWRTNMDMGVNNRVLSLAIEELGGLTLLNSLEISAASISDKFNQGFGDKGMVDFCIYLHLDSKRYAKERNEIDRLYESPEGTRINHTKFEPLTYFPIALSINTRGNILDLGRWESARWACLKSLIKDCTVDAWKGDPKPSLPEFLPAILVTDDDWNLVVTTHENENTTIWHQIKMGSTSNMQGIYQIIACLHALREWAEDVFWPWLRNLLLHSRPSYRRKRFRRSRPMSHESYEERRGKDNP